MTTHGAIVESHQLLVGYGEHSVADPLSFTAGRGTVFAVVGANGSGKSTLLRTLAGFLPALGGAATIDGERIDERQADFRAFVATVFDDDAFFPSLSVAEHLTLVATGHNVADSEHVVDTEIDFFGLGSVVDALPANLSSGQRRRMLLAAALVRPSGLLVLDEPEQRLDTGMRRRLRERIRAVSAAGTTVVMATHDPEFVAECANAVLVIEDPVRYLDPAAGAAALHAL